MNISRRTALTGLGTATALGLAGCLASPTQPSDSDEQLSGSAAFFTLMDWGNHVGEGVITFETPVEVGEMGHGWDPDADIVPQIAQHDVFLYLHTPEFQWAIDVAAELSDEDHGIRLIDGMDAIARSDLLPFVTDARLPEPDSDEDYDPATVEITDFNIHVGGNVAAWWHGDHWHGGVPEVPLDDTRTLYYSVEDRQGNILPLGAGEPFSVRAKVPNDAPADPIDIDDQGEATLLTGATEGQTLLVFEVIADQEVIFDTADDPLVVSVVEPAAVEVDAFHDPHVWPDPIFAQQIVDHIADELVDVTPGDEATLRENAADYNERVAAIDRQFEQVVEEAELDVAVYVAHDAFQYVEQRYGFELRTPVGVTPDAAESIEDVAELAKLIEEGRIDTILFDPFEAPNPDEDVPQAVRVLLEDTSAEHAEPLSPAEGITPSWREQGYGWVEVMEEINLPSLRKALRA